MNKKLKSIKKVVATIFSGFTSHSLMTSAAAIAFYTLFSLPGLLVTIVVIAGIFLGPEAASGELSQQLSGFIGPDIANSIEGVIVQVDMSDENTFKTIFGIGILIFSATTIFMCLQEALNKIWDVAAQPKRGIVKFLINRVLSLGMIVGMGFILIVSLIGDTLLELFFDKIQSILGEEPSLLLNITSSVVSFAIVFIIIGMIFKFLPDVQLRWKDVTMAALITTALFIAGKYAIQLYLANSSFTETYQAAGSVVILLIWVYYSTIVVLLGAEITRAIMIYKGNPIRPSAHAKKVSIEHLDYETYKTHLEND